MEVNHANVVSCVQFKFEFKSESESESGFESESEVEFKRLIWTTIQRITCSSRFINWDCNLDSDLNSLYKRHEHGNNNICRDCSNIGVSSSF